MGRCGLRAVAVFAGGVLAFAGVAFGDDATARLTGRVSPQIALTTYPP